MKKISLPLVCVALMFSSCKEESLDAAFVSQFSITSVINNGTYEIKVSQPSDYFTSGEKYATVYVLDGEDNFNFVANECKRLSTEHGVANVLVVSIGYGNERNTDYTPTRTDGQTGGAPLFLKFIKRELVPRIEKDFGADTTRSHRVILGHSFGGLFGAAAFGADNTLFENYILLSPSLWYDNEVTMFIESIHRAANVDQQQLIFMGIGEMENAGRMQAPFDAFHSVLQANYSKLLIATNREKDLDHMGSKNPNIRKGLEFYFLNR